MTLVRKSSRTMTGRVVSNKMDRTVAVLVQWTVQHPLYDKYVRRTTQVLAHDEKNECQEGDIVVIESTRPLSKRKSWRLERVLIKAEQV